MHYKLNHKIIISFMIIASIIISGLYLHERSLRMEYTMFFYKTGVEYHIEVIPMMLSLGIKNEDIIWEEETFLNNLTILFINLDRGIANFLVASNNILKVNESVLDTLKSLKQKNEKILGFNNSVISSEQKHKIITWTNLIHSCINRNIHKKTWQQIEKELNCLIQ